MRVLGDDALVPERNRMTAPERFTHELSVAQPYFYEIPSGGRAADGKLAARARVQLVRDEGEFSWVVDEAGVLVVTQRAGLAPLPST